MLSASYYRVASFQRRSKLPLPGVPRQLLKVVPLLWELRSVWIMCCIRASAKFLEGDVLSPTCHSVVMKMSLADLMKEDHHTRNCVRSESCVIMLDLGCDQMIVEMFQRYLQAIIVEDQEKTLEPYPLLSPPHNPRYF